MIPSFNQGHFIEETIRSVLLQGYPDVELLVIDGGSQDSTVEVIRRYEPWISHWVSEPDRGQTHAINKGLARATGEIFTYLNSDDLLAPGALTAVAEAFSEEPAADVVHGYCIYIDETGTELFRRMGRVSGLPAYLRIWERFRDNEFLTQPEVFSRKAVLDRVGPFRESLHSVMDFEMWVRLLSQGAMFHAVGEPLAMFRVYATQKSAVDPGFELCGVIEEYALDERSPLTPEERTGVLKDLPNAKAHLLVRAAIGATMTGLYGKALRYCWQALRASVRIAGTYPFWAVVLSPLKSVLPARVTRGVRRFFNPSSP